MLRIQILGGLNITLGDEPVVGFISGKAQALLCYVAINNKRPHLRTSLAALFWGEMLDEDAATNLRQAIANLKRLLEPYLEITRQSIAFNTESPYWLDVEEFESTQDPQLYQGELLAGFGLPDSPAFDNWLTTQREYLHDLAISTFRKQAAAHLANSDEVAAIDSLNKLLALDPLQEEAHRQLMRAFVMHGQRNAALVHYEKCRDILQRELDIEPEAETLRLYERIKSAQKLTNLPNETAPLIGREQEMAEVSRQLANPTCHHITIVGLGGIGKTRLALRVAHQQSNRMLHGAVMVNLTSIHTLEFFLSALADSLEFSLSREGSPGQQLLNYLREKHLLLVLDNFEQLTDVASKFVSEMLHTAPDLKIIVTSRERLNLRGEWTLALHGLLVQQDSSPSAPALDLFWETARRVRGDNLMAGQSVAAVRRICQLVEGMPLAIELAAAWTRLLTCEELADELASNMTALEATTRDGEERHHSLRAVFDQSWQLFSAHEQAVLRALSSFVAGFTREAAEEVAGASLPMLLGLTDKMLVRRETGNRFSLHEMVRQYLVEKLVESAEMHAVRTAFVCYYVQFVQAHEARLKSAEQLAALNEIMGDIDNLHHAWALALADKDTAALLGMMPVLSLYHDMTATWIVGEAIFNASAPAFADASLDARGVWLSHMALLASRLDHTEESQRRAQECLTALADKQDVQADAVARAIMVLGIIADTHGHHVESEKYYYQALRLRERTGDIWGCANCYINLAGARGRQGDLAEARRLAEYGLEVCQSSDNPWLITRLQMVLGLIAEMNGELARAESLHRANLEIFETQNNTEGLALTYNGLGLVALKREEYQRARDYLNQALELNRQLGVRQWEANTTLRLGETLRGMGDNRSALNYYQQSLALYRLIGHDDQIKTLEQEIETLNQLVG